MIVVDTHVFIWDALGSDKLSTRAKAALDEAEKTQSLWLADFSLWEVFMLVKRGRLTLPVSATQFVELALQARNYQLQRMTASIAEESVNFGTKINNDPADRLIVATARYLRAELVTADVNLQECGLVKVVW
ncbi:MAG: type II toxin-antitoxin system VapC family toxin [Agitococcus sp.]|nr:type II toxin-antitoxin system VapC family toxin [Agitococcus sp.]